MSNHPKANPVTLMWIELTPGRFVPSFRDHRLNLIEPFLDYAISEAKKKISDKASARAYTSAMDSIAYSLSEFAGYLQSKGKSWAGTTDDILEEFRDASHTETRTKKTSKNNTTASRTINKKLRVIYDFFAWAEVNAALTQGKIGWGTEDIKSTRPLHLKNPTKWNGLPRNQYPKCLQGVGEKSRSMDSQYWATEQDLDDIEDYFGRTLPSATAERNILFMRITDQTGFRRASTNSLTIGQFSDAAINESLRQGLVAHSAQPASQKLTKNYHFDISYALAWEINRYIKQLFGEELATQSCHVKKVADLPIFVSITTGRPLTDNHWSDIFTAAFQAMGADRGAGLHAIRRKFAEDWFRKEIERRLKNNLSIAYEDIVAGLARVLGHDSKLSQEAYRRVSKATTGATTEDRLQEQNQQQTAQILKLKAELARKDRLFESFTSEQRTKPKKRSGAFPASK